MALLRFAKGLRHNMTSNPRPCAGDCPRFPVARLPFFDQREPMIRSCAVMPNHQDVRVLHRFVERKQAFERAGDVATTRGSTAVSREVEIRAASHFVPEAMEVVGLRIALDIDRKRQDTVRKFSRRNRTMA